MSNLTLFGGEGDYSKEALIALEQEILAMPQIPLVNKHYFANGIYARELLMPAGSCVTGKIHKQEHICTISYGDVTVVTDEGTERYTGHSTFIGKPGSKRALYMHEDTMWTAYHRTDKTTVEEAEAEVVTNDYQLYLAGK